MRLEARVRLAILLGMLGCSRQPQSCIAPSPGSAPAQAPPDPVTQAQVEQILASDLDDAGADDAGGLGFIDLVRRDAWDDAAAALAALPPEKKRKATVRLLTGRVAMARGDYETAKSALTGLEKELAPVADDIQKWTAEAQANVGPFEPAARYFVKQGGSAALGKAAVAFEKAGIPSEALAAAEKAIAQGKGDAVSLRALRARVAEGLGDKAKAGEDLRFIVLKSPGSDEGKAALAALARLDPAHPLTGKERRERAEKLVDQGRTDDALRELELAKKAISPPSEDELNWTHASALYRSRGRYEAAATEYDKIAKKRGPKQAEAAFLAARALSRADHDDEAAEAYASVARRFATSSWADEASYLAARLHYLHGSFGDATTAYAAYLKKFPTGKEKDDAVYEHALSLLADGKYTRARAELHALAQGAGSASEAARLRQLEGLAAKKAGDLEGAAALFREVIHAQPLSWAASAARARLLEETAADSGSQAAGITTGAGSPGAGLTTDAGSPGAGLTADAGSQVSTALAMIETSDGKEREPLVYKLPAVADLYHRLGLDSDAETYLKAHEKDAVIELKGREKEGLCAMYGDLGRAARLYRIAVDAVPAAVLTRAPSAGSEWAWKCLYPRPYLDRVHDLEARETLPKGLIYAVMRQESAYDPDAVSGARAVGLLQLMPETARRVAEEAKTPYEEKLLRTPAINLDLGARYLAKMLRTFDGNVPMAAAAYNAGPGAVRKWVERRKGLDLDLWVALIPFEETRTYVNKVMSNLARYAYLDGGETAVPAVKLTVAARVSTSAPNKDSAEY